MDGILINEEINRWQRKKAIVECDGIITEESDGGFRFILNLKQLNKSIEKKKFKISFILCLIRPNIFAQAGY